MTEIMNGFLKLHPREIFKTQGPPNTLTVKQKHLTVVLKMAHVLSLGIQSNAHQTSERQTSVENQVWVLNIGSNFVLILIFVQVGDSGLYIENVDQWNCAWNQVIFSGEVRGII